MKKLLSVLLALAMLSIAGLALAEAEPVTLNVAYMPNYGSLWAIETAIQKGYLAEENITVNLVEFADGTVEGYYLLQRDTFVANGAVEKDPVPAVSDYVMLDVMIEAGK
ncbi:MAG: hypothetical protein MSL26_09465 [Clostridiales bacterium]|nr:hypothetical protein [Clostridiales bacterium]